MLCLCCCLWFGQCHFASELHGLAAHPTAPEFITVGDDRLLRIWNIRDRKVGREGRKGGRQGGKGGREGGEVGKAGREGGKEARGSDAVEVVRSQEAMFARRRAGPRVWGLSGGSGLCVWCVIMTSSPGEAHARAGEPQSGRGI